MLFIAKYFPRIHKIFFFIKHFNNIKIEHLQLSLFSKNSFNGQYTRQDILNNVFEKSNFKNVIETGTFLGNSINFFLKFKQITKIYSCEIVELFYLISKHRYRNYKNIEIKHCDSLIFLKGFIKDNADKNEQNFFYLDAHNYYKNQIRQELLLIRNLPSFLICIDDFKSAYNKRFVYDDYGQQGILEINFIKDLVKDFEIFMPDFKPYHQSSIGFLLITNDKNISKILKNTSGIKIY